MKVVIQAQKNLLQNNDDLSKKIKDKLAKAKVKAYNLMSSPGSGKTTLLEVTAELLAKELKIGVIEGDIATDHDAERIARKNVPVVQINTGSTCHLEASMIEDSLSNFPDWQSLDILFIENVGNLLCPASFNLGENKKVVLLSVPEGEDKPLKYPLMFKEADLILLTKIDLIEAMEYDMEKVKKDIYTLNSNVNILEISSKKKTGLVEWVQWLKDEIE